ncbi:hypothetical protein AB0J63_26840 [Streptosporangium canum]|uniref:hypothetical protein n=1 Tax=Streptosporangium canum TaxID=324952 RepID=UPI0034358B20
MTRTERERDMAERFQKDTAAHEMTILHDDGLYRHLRFQAPGSSFYWFDLVTTPHALIFRGDGTSFVFSRLKDMFEFFRGPVGRINPRYWAEKLTSDRDSVMKYDPELFEQLVKEAFVDAVRYGDAPRGLGKAVREEILNSEFLAYEDEARRILDDFEFGEQFRVSCRCGAKDEYDDRAGARKWADEHVKESEGSHVPSIHRLPAFSFSDTWEWSFRGYDWWFLWALHGIVWGIAQYDSQRAASLTPAEQSSPSQGSGEQS